MNKRTNKQNKINNETPFVVGTTLMINESNYVLDVTTQDFYIADLPLHGISYFVELSRGEEGSYSVNISRNDRVVDDELEKTSNRVFTLYGAIDEVQKWADRQERKLQGSTFHVVTSEGVSVAVFEHSDEARDYRDNQYFGYYKNCEVKEVTENYAHWMKCVKSDRKIIG